MKFSRKFLPQFILFLLISLLLFLLCREVFKKEVFHVESRVENVLNQTFIEKENDFEMIGWVRVQGTSLDLPIVHSNQNKYDYPVQTKGYTWTTISDRKLHNVITVAGHNVYNLSSTPKLSSDRFFRFEELMSFIYYDFAKENEYFQLTIGQEEYVYKIFAVSFLTNEKILSFPTEVDYTKDEMKKFLSYLKEQSFYRYHISVNENDNIASLVTCTRFYGTNTSVELFVSGRLLRKGEKMTQYRVYKNKKYSEIEETLRGDLDEEENI